jgi:hypothetical protein
MDFGLLATPLRRPAGRSFIRSRMTAAFKLAATSTERSQRARARRREGSTLFMFEGSEVGIKALLEEARLLDITDWDDPYKVQEALTIFMRTIVKERL